LSRQTLTEVIVAKCLYKLRDEEKSKFDWVLLQDPMGVLKKQWVTIIPRLKESVCNNRWDRCPKKYVLKSNVSEK
jgi:hypothetical protein